MEILQQSTGEFQPIQIAYHLNEKKLSELVTTNLYHSQRKRETKSYSEHWTKIGIPQFDVLDEQDSITMARLLDPILPEINDTCIFLPNSREIGEAVKETYSKVKDAAQIYNLMTETYFAKQISRSGTKYASILKNWWQELNQYRYLTVDCSKNATALNKFVEKNKAYLFIARPLYGILSGDGSNLRERRHVFTK